MAIMGEAHPMKGNKESSMMDMIYTVCHKVFLAATRTPLTTSESYCLSWKSNVFPSMIDAVFSLKNEKTGDPMINQMYLNREKYKSIRTSQSITPPMVNKNPIQLS